MKKLIAFSVALLTSATCVAQTEGWSLQDCLNYALEHNLQLRESRAGEALSDVSVRESRADWLPSLSANLSQNMQHRPFQQAATHFVNGGITTSASDKTTWSGSYGISTSWTVWNGGLRSLNIKDSRLAQKQAAYETQQIANSIQEQVAQLYVQILYMREALSVNSQLLHHDSLIYQRGERMLLNGQISRSDLTQLRAQLSQGRYDVVNSETQLLNTVLSLKQVLELSPSDELTIAPLNVEETQIVAPLPSKEQAYARALSLRPEMKSTLLNLERSQLAVKQAKAAYHPTVSLQGSIGDSYMSGSVNTWAKQMKYNVNMMLGLSVQIPLYDKRRAKSSVERAKINQLTAQINRLDAKKKIYNSVETYWLNATNSQHKYLAAVDNVESLQQAYDNTCRQFDQGQKDITDLLDSRGRLLQAKQSLLQDKYTALLNKALLDFYAGEPIEF